MRTRIVFIGSVYTDLSHLGSAVFGRYYSILYECASNNHNGFIYHPAIILLICLKICIVIITGSKRKKERERNVWMCGRIVRDALKIHTITTAMQ